MAKFELQDGQMFIFSNEDRDPERNHPTHRGRTKIDGTEYWVSCWVKEGKNGKFFSCSLQEKDNGFNEQNKPANNNNEEFDEDVPF